MKYILHTCLNVVRPEFYSGWEGWLTGPCGDGQSLGDELSLAGFESRNLFNDAATFAGLDGAMTKLAEDASEGDTVILHHSHHGGRRDNGLFGGYQETFCLSDGELPDTKWLEMVARFKPGVNVIAILDCCHAGGMDRSGPNHYAGRAKVRPGFLNPQLRTWPSLRTEPIECNFVILPACRAEEVSVETTIEEITAVRGAWTWALVRELQKQREVRGPVLLPDLYEAGRKYCAQHFPAQHPRVVKLGRNPETAWQTRIA
jgi:hypothetical protein